MPPACRPGSTRPWGRSHGAKRARSCCRGWSGRTVAAARGSGGSSPRCRRSPRSGPRCVEIHGQHGSLGLLAAGTQAAFLDRFAGADHLAVLQAYRTTFEGLRGARATLGELSSDARDRERELDLLAYQIREIETVDPRPGETEALEAEEVRLAHVERLQELAAGVEELLAGDGGAADGLAAADRALASCADLDPGAAGLAERSRGLAAETAELARDARAYREGLASDPARLDAVRERVAALKGLRRKYGATDHDVLTFLDQASARLGGARRHR